MIKKIEIDFPCLVSVPQGFYQQLAELIDKVCDCYESEHPNEVMWPAEHGSKIISIPITKEDEENGVPLKFDDTIYRIGVCKRERY